MRNVLLGKIAAAFLLIPFCFSAQSDWDWVGGSSTSQYQGPVFGTQGISAPSNTPGNTLFCLTWKDHSGNFWLYGGRNNNSVDRGELWKYNTATNEWTWMTGSGANAGGQAPVYGMQGVASASNDPGSRKGSVTWTDNAGNLWLYGGDNFTLGDRSDFWKYDILTNQWTWMGGSSSAAIIPAVYGTMGVPSFSTTPGDLAYATSWMDNGGNLWVFGGRGFDASGNGGVKDDLWNYSLSTNQWTWVKGTALVNQLSVYGTINVSSATNLPGNRYLSSGWVSNTGDLYLFGGIEVFSPNFDEATMNDFWKFDISSGNWTWVGGSTGIDQAGIFGVQGTPSATNFPGSRCAHYTWKDSKGDFWMLGGESYSTSAASPLEANDLWKYNVSSSIWTWMSGSTLPSQPGVYGTQGTPAQANTPGARFGGATWTDSTGDFWLYSGGGQDQTLYYSPSDMWKIKPDTSSTTATVGIQEEKITAASIYPNPAKSNFVIEPAVQTPGMLFKLFDVKGQLIKGGKIISSPNSISVEDLSKGIYLLQLYDNDKVIVSKKLIIE